MSSERSTAKFLCNETIVLHYVVSACFNQPRFLDLVPDQKLAENVSPNTPADRLEPAEFKRGPGGRPTRQEAARRHGALLDKSIRLFLDHGLDAVSIDQIAREAAVAKRFIYARYRDKSALFIAALEHWAKDRLDVLQTFAPSEERAEIGLVEFGRAILDMTLEADALALQRLLFAAAARLPDLVANIVTRNRHRGVIEVERVLRFYAARGEIELSDVQATAEQFFIAVVGIPQRLALLGLREPPTQERRRLRLAVRLFLNGCRVRRARG
jgi:TetR/AcrR family transcriptional regulator, mexJK operon transcriptional repressor